MHELDSFFMIVVIWGAWNLLLALVGLPGASIMLAVTIVFVLLSLLLSLYRAAYDAQVEYEIALADVSEDESADDSSGEDSSSEEIPDRLNYVDEKALREEDECNVCRENKKCFMVVPCGHVVACGACSDKVELGRCPVCRRRGREWKRIFY